MWNQDYGFDYLHVRRLIRQEHATDVVQDFLVYNYYEKYALRLPELLKKFLQLFLQSFLYRVLKMNYGGQSMKATNGFILIHVVARNWLC